MAKVKVELIRAYWPENDVRVDEGTQVEVEVEDAMKLIEEGAAKRVDDKKPKQSAEK